MEWLLPVKSFLHGTTRMREGRNDYEELQLISFLIIEGTCPCMLPNALLIDY